MDDVHQDIKKIFRDAMATLGAGVNIITTDGIGGKCGLTATAVVSITDSPPTMLVSINRNSATNDTFKANTKLAINILNADQQLAAEYFGGMHPVSMEDRFAKFDFAIGKSGLPILKEAIANLEGSISATHEVGTHTLFIVTLDHMNITDNGDALIYFNRDFHQLPRVK
ncbi:flavin reductase [Ignatzschineria sp. LJL83]